MLCNEVNRDWLQSIMDDFHLLNFSFESEYEPKIKINSLDSGYEYVFPNFTDVSSLIKLNFCMQTDDGFRDMCIYFSWKLVKNGKIKGLRKTLKNIYESCNTIVVSEDDN